MLKFSTTINVSKGVQFDTSVIKDDNVYGLVDGKPMVYSMASAQFINDELNNQENALCRGDLNEYEFLKKVQFFKNNSQIFKKVQILSSEAVDTAFETVNSKWFGYVKGDDTQFIKDFLKCYQVLFDRLGVYRIYQCHPMSDIQAKVARAVLENKVDGNKLYQALQRRGYSTIMKADDSFLGDWEFTMNGKTYPFEFYLRSIQPKAKA